MAASALMTIGRMPERDVVEADRPSCVTCARNWMVVAARHAALSGDVERALALADEIASATTGTSLAAALAVAHLRAIAHARAGRSADAERAAEEARAAYRATGRADTLVMLDRDLALISALHA